jgi:hypothetical protein
VMGEAICHGSHHHSLNQPRTAATDDEQVG